MPCLIRDDGVVFPVDPNLVGNARFRYSEHIPAEHLRTIAAVREREEERARAFAEQRARLKLQDEEIMRRQREAMVKAQILPPVTSQNEQAELDAKVFTGDMEFVISKAGKEELVAWAKEHHNVQIDKRMSLDDIRAKVARLAGVEQKAA